MSVLVAILHISPFLLPDEQPAAFCCEQKTLPLNPRKEIEIFRLMPDTKPIQQIVRRGLTDVKL